MSSTFRSAISCKLYLLLLLFQLFCSSLSKLDIDETTSVYNNSLFGDNDLWSSLYDQCGSRSSYRCVQDNVYSFLDRTLESDIFESDALLFRQNENNYTDLCRRVKKDDPGEYNERLGKKLDSDGGNDGEFQDFIDKVEEVERLDGEMTRRGRDLDDSKQSNDISSPDNAEGHDSNVNDTKSIRDVTDILYNRGLKYLMTHDMELSLPSFVFGGGKVQVSPKGFADDGGVLVKLNVVPDQPQEGRFFFKQLQKIFKKKLMTSMLAAMLILKLLKLKAMFFLPLLLGVGTAKKLLLKVLLFLFPALAHLFKLCSYYHHKHAKYHHHHHQIAHHHHHIPVPVYTPVHTAPGELPAPYPASYESSGPGGVYSHSRTESPGSLADLAAWGLGEYPAAWDTLGVGATDLPKYTYPTRAQQLTAATQQYASQSELKRLYAAPTKTSPQYSAALASRFQALTPRPAHAGVASAASPPVTAYDPFYSPMLQRLDTVFGHLGVQEEGCRERLVCSMYKNPARFSPHSNLVSAELSRDPSELQKPTSANSAVVRFYRYIQSARDGQELKDCLRIYAACAISTE